MNYSLPASTILNKPLYKKAVFEKFNLKTAEREHFDADIGKMVLMAFISQDRVPALSEGKDIKGIYVLQVLMKRKEYDAKNILLLQKLIPQKIIFLLQYEELSQLCIFHTRLQQSEWNDTDSTEIPLKGLTLDEVWENIVATIGNLDIDSEETIEEQIIKREEREKLLRQIEMLEKRCRLEKQTRKKFELHQELKTLKLKIKQI